MSTIYRIGNLFRLDPDAGVLSRGGKPMPVGPRGISLLTALVENPNEYISKFDLLDVAWPHSAVDEGNLAVQITAIRRVFSVEQGQRWIETLRSRGYRFVGPVTREESYPGATTSSIPQSNLPAALTSFVGRERELVEVKRLLSLKRLITIQGVGGIGKTRLALQVASEAVDAYRDGVWLAELASMRDGALVPAAVAHLLGVAEKPNIATIASLCAHLKCRQVLLVLDNCEHLIDACATLADAVLQQARDVTILATSREPLRLAGEQSYVLESLSLPEPRSHLEIEGSEAVQLFVERVQAQLPAFELTADRSAVVAEICIHLDGIPLALELAAARARSLSVEQINARLADRFPLLTTGARTASPRQRTLRATLDWSYELLIENERVVLRRLAVFPSTFTVEAASAVASGERIDEHAVIDVVSQLVSRSLVIADTGGAGVRYRLLETLRAYAVEKLAETGEHDACQRRHAGFYRELFEREFEGWLRVPDPEWRTTYLPELENVRAALDWALVEGGDMAIAIDLAGASGPLWVTLGLFGEGVQRLQAASASIKADTPVAAQARLWLWLGRLHSETVAKALPALERAVELYRTLNAPVERGISLVRLARVVARMGRFDEADAMLTEACPLLQHSGPRALNQYHFNAGFLKNVMGDSAAARAHYERALELARELRDELSVMATLGNLANVKWGLGDLDATTESMRELVSLIRRSPTSTRHLLGTGLMNFAALLHQKNDLEGSITLAREGLPLMKAEGKAWVYSDYGAQRAASRNDLARAAVLLGYADHAHTLNNATRHSLALPAHSRLQALLREKFSAADLARLLTEGAELTEEEACRLALAD